MMRSKFLTVILYKFIQVIKIGKQRQLFKEKFCFCSGIEISLFPKKEVRNYVKSVNYKKDRLIIELLASGEFKNISCNI